MEQFPILIGFIISYISKTLKIGAGATWPGEIALRIDPYILPKLLIKVKLGVIIVAGTNGKTTTSLMIKNVLEEQGLSVLHNESGANLQNGIVSSFFSKNRSVYDYAVFEVDENSLPGIITNIQRMSKRKNGLKLTIALLNLFRDQLDRYGEVDTIAKNWLQSLKIIDKQTKIIINADDPHLAFIGKNITADISYFGIQDLRYYLSKMQHATDTIFCPSCGERLSFEGVYFSHLGDWHCPKCKFTHPQSTIVASDVKSPLEGIYNIYNTLASTMALLCVGLHTKAIQKGLEGFKPAFGRMEHLSYKGNNIRILLSKNPTGFNESLRTCLSSKHKGPMMLLLNDRIPDGTDVSWIWDVDFEVLTNFQYPLVISGDRALDMALRMKYSMAEHQGRSLKQLSIEKELQKAVEHFVSIIKNEETGWILSTYSAMLDVRKIITGKKIL